MKELLKSNTVGYINPDVSICVHKYEQAKKSGKMNDQLKDYLDRWDKLGFLQGFPNDRKEELAFAYEQLAIFLIYCESDQTDRLFERNDNGYNAFETIGFPMTRRIIGNLEPNEFDFQKYLKYCKELNPKDVMDYVEKLNPIVNPDLHAEHRRKYFDMDAEAEAVAWCCDMIQEKFKNPDKDSETIKKEHFEKINKLIEERKEKLKDERASSDNTNE